MKKTISIILILIFSLIALTGCQVQNRDEENFKIVTSFYPMYVIAKNITNNVEGVVVENMASQNVGCLHDYTLTTSDLKKVEQADVFIINGLRIETFIEKILETYSEIDIIEASQNIDNLKQDEHETNAHVWLDIDKYIEQVENVKQGLIKSDYEHENQYTENGEEYKQKLKSLKANIEENTKNTKRCLSFSETLDYLEETMNLEIKTIETDHENNGLSAEAISEAIEYVKTNNIKNIILDKDTADNNARIIASETEAKIYVLDSGLSGSEELDSYINMMNENLEIIKNMEE